MSFEIIAKFEEELAEYFGSKYAVAVDSCTHGVELCLRYTNAKVINCPKRTYISIPFLANKLNIQLNWKDEKWSDYYYLTDQVIDAAVLWGENTYINNTFMSISFQYQKHLSLGRGGVILTDNKLACETLKKMSYDGRSPNTPWRSQNINSVGFHYYMTPETAALGIEKFKQAKISKPKKWTVDQWPDLTQMDIFN